MKKLLLVALLFGAAVKAENTILTAELDPREAIKEAVVEKVVKPATKAGFWALMGYLAIVIKF